MNKADNNKNDNGKSTPPPIGIEVQDFLGHLCHIAKGNLVALVRVTAVTEHLRRTAEDLPEGDETKDALHKACQGLALAGLILAKQGKDLSDAEDALVEAVQTDGYKCDPIQGEQLCNVFSDHGKAGKEWLNTTSGLKKTQPPEDRDEKPSDNSLN